MSFWLWKTASDASRKFRTQSIFFLAVSCQPQVTALPSWSATFRPLFIFVLPTVLAGSSQQDECLLNRNILPSSPLDTRHSDTVELSLVDCHLRGRREPEMTEVT